MYKHIIIMSDYTYYKSSEVTNDASLDYKIRGFFVLLLHVEHVYEKIKKCRL